VVLKKRWPSPGSPHYGDHRENALRKIETACPTLSREEDRETVRHQLDLQHDDVLRRLDYFVLDQASRRVVWTDQSRSVDAVLLAWTMSAVAQLAEAEAGTEETCRLLRLTLERAATEEDSLRLFHVTPLGRVVVPRTAGGAAPRGARRAAWCFAFAEAALQANGKTSRSPSARPRGGTASSWRDWGFMTGCVAG
jgi:hypothetical protein